MVAISPCHRPVPSPRATAHALLALACGVLLLACPAVAQGQPSSDADVLRLQNGNVIEGVILVDGETTVTIRIAHGQEVEIPKSLIAKLVRRSTTDSARTKAPESLWPARHTWFQLRDVEGRLVGKLHYHVRPQKGGGAQLEQQWTFLEKGKKSFVTRIEVVDSAGEPLSFVYREGLARVSDGRSLRERLVQGKVRGGKLELNEAGTSGRTTRKLPFPTGNSFPLAVAESLRRGDLDGAHGFDASVYDPLDGVFELRRYRMSEGAPAPRVSDASARRTGVRVIESVEHGRKRREWVSASGQILLIEVNGIHLVAEPVSEKTAMQLGAYEKARSAPRVRKFRDYDVWLPRATWSFGRELQRARKVELVPPTDDVAVQVRWLGNENPGEAILQSAGERLLKLYRIEHESFHETGQELVTIGELPGLRIDGYEKDKLGRKRPVQIWLREVADGWLATTVAGAPKSVAAIRGEVVDLIQGMRKSAPSAVAAKPGR